MTEQQIDPTYVLEQLTDADGERRDLIAAYIAVDAFREDPDGFSPGGIAVECALRAAETSRAIIEMTVAGQWLGTDFTEAVSGTYYPTPEEVVEALLFIDRFPGDRTRQMGLETLRFDVYYDRPPGKPVPEEKSSYKRIERSNG